MADTSPSFSTRHSVLSSSGKDDLYSILGRSNGAENRPLATYPVKQFSREKRGTRVATPAIMGTLANSPRYTLASRNFTRLSSFFFFPTRNGSGMIFFSDFSLDLRGNAFFSGRKTLLRCTVSFRVYFYYESVGKQLISQLFEKEFRWSFSVDTINGYLTHRDDFAIFF